MGIGVGIAAATVPVYISEASPAHIRGMLTVINTVCVSSGQLIANVVDALFGNTPHGWRCVVIPARFSFTPSAFAASRPLFLPQLHVRRLGCAGRHPARWLSLPAREPAVPGLQRQD